MLKKKLTGLTKEKILSKKDSETKGLLENFNKLGKNLQKNIEYKYVCHNCDGKVKVIRIILNHNLVYFDNTKVNRFIVTLKDRNKNCINVKFHRLVKLKLNFPLDIFMNKAYEI